MGIGNHFEVELALKDVCCKRIQLFSMFQSDLRAHKYLISRLQRRCFLYWRTLADENRRNRMADAMHRQHMLRKGLQGFTWAIMRSKHRTRTLEMRVSAITIRAYFSKVFCFVDVVGDCLIPAWDDVLGHGEPLKTRVLVSSLPPTHTHTYTHTQRIQKRSFTLSPPGVKPLAFWFAV